MVRLLYYAIKLFRLNFTPWKSSNSGISTGLMNSPRRIMSRVFFSMGIKKWAKNIRMVNGNLIAESAMQVSAFNTKIQV